MRNQGTIAAATGAVCLLLVVSQIFLKYSLTRVASGEGGILAFLRPLICSSTFWLAITCTALASVLWLLVLRSAPISVAYPLISLSYVLMVPAARIAFREPVTLPKVVGTAVICLGVFIVSRALR